MRVWALALAVGCGWNLVGCGPDDEGDASGEAARAFPDGFRWGAAVAGFQVDMGCPTLPASACDDPNSDWYAWVTDPTIVEDAGNFVTGEPVANGPGMWETFDDDVGLMAADGYSGFRMSIEWSRLFPDGAAEAATTVDELGAYADPEAVAWYHAAFASLRAAGIEPIVTVNHYTLPLWVHEPVACHLDIDTCLAKGWVDGERIVPLIALYAGFVGREYGGDVDQWFTLNEPFATTASGYLSPSEDRSAPPGLSFAVEPTVAVMLNQIDGHARMYDALHEQDAVDADGDGETAVVGIVMNMVDITPKDPDRPEDVLAAEHADYLYHQLYLNAFVSGDWDADLDGVAEANRPELAGRLDALGINYYNELVVTGLPFPPVAEVPVFDFFPEYSWDPHPEGLGDVVTRAAAFGRPIWVTENGTPHVVEEGVQVLDGHLSSLHEAIAAGADVRGYMYWSFIDNYEWNHGLAMRFGLYELDPVTKARAPRPVRDRLRDIAGENGLD